MIRRGRAEGWLSLAPEAFSPWALLNGIELHEVKAGGVAGKGSALLAKRRVENSSDGAECLLTVPRDLILGLERVHEQTKVDKDVREVFESLGDFVTTPRGAILSFLLIQASIVSPHLTARVGVHGPFTDYVKSLPFEFLPTFWTPEELDLLVGTTLLSATTSKLRSLRQEYGLFCQNAASTRWYGLVRDHLEFDDWLQVDAMYRSRALDYPEIGHCMVPCLDLANHAPHEATIAVYEKDKEGNAILLLREDKVLEDGDEVTITYGDEKGACEMLFSYGFLDADMSSAESLFLGLVIPENDPQRQGKLNLSGCAPGVKMSDASGHQIGWEGEFVWLLCVNAEDGLHFDIARTVDGDEEVHAFFKGEEIDMHQGAPELYRRLESCELWDVYRLRAVSILQQRVLEQLQLLFSSQEDVVNVEHGEATEVRERPYEMAMQLRGLEFGLLERAYEEFEKQKLELAQSEVVQKYLKAMTMDDEQDAPHAAQQEGEEEDFS